MRKKKEFNGVRFKPEVFREAWIMLNQHIADGDEVGIYEYYSVEIDGASWEHDTEEEFFSDYRRSTSYAHFQKQKEDIGLDVNIFLGFTSVAISAGSRVIIEKGFQVFEEHVEESRLPREDAKLAPTVFIGHGRSQQWRDLKDHLHDKHGIEVEAYEVGARAGHAIRDILEDMLENSSFAVLVMTAEDEIAEASYRARQNVIHETGLFQGRLGFSRAIVLLEEGTEEFSNIHGIQQIRFSKGNIKETYGEILATLRREFGVSAV